MDVNLPTEEMKGICRRVNLPHGAILYLLHELIVYHGLVEENQEHRHFVMQLGFAPDASVKLISEGRLHDSQGAVLTGPNVPHQLLGQGKPQLLLFLDPVSATGRALRRLVLAGQPVCIFPDAEVQQAALALSTAAADQRINPDKIMLLVAKLLETILPAPATAPPLDPRIAHVLKYIGQEQETTPGINALADLAALSEGRLMHLFKAEVGVPLRQYLLFRRLLKAIHLLLDRRLNFTQAAHEAGFADSAHFTRTFRQMIGFTPFAIFKR